MKPFKPYYAVIFTTVRTPVDAGYTEMAGAMLELASRQPGYLGVEHARDTTGITVSYWESLEAIAAWKDQADHRVAREMGRSAWYAEYKLRICRVEREYAFRRPDYDPPA